MNQKFPHKNPGNKSKRLTFYICLGLAVATFAAYWQLTNNEFVHYDDDQYVTENPYVNKGLNLNNIKWFKSILER